MKAKERTEILKANHLADWLKERHNVDNELSKKQAMFCVCGKLATGFHERSCKKFNLRVDTETEKRLRHLTEEAARKLPR